MFGGSVTERRVAEANLGVRISTLAISVINICAFKNWIPLQSIWLIFFGALVPHIPIYMLHYHLFQQSTPFSPCLQGHIHMSKKILS